MLSGSLLTPALKPVGTASSIRRDDDDFAIATHPYDDYSHLQQQHQAQQHKQLDEARYEALRPVKDSSTLGSELSVLALRSTYGSYTNTEAGSPLVTQGPTEGSVDELPSQRRLQAVEHSEDVHDSGVCELTNFLNR